MSTYSKANTTAQWFQDDYPGSVLNLTAETMVLVVHTTEGMTWPGYNGGATAPNYTGMPPLGSKAGSWRAHFPDERSSRALRNLSGGVATNTLNAVQVELIGTCDPAHAKTWGSKKAGVDYVYWPNANDAQLKWLAHFVADMRKRHGLRLVFPTFKAYPGSYGATSTRFTFAEWRNFAGICGHQHVPENSHGDPGNIDMAKVVAFAKAILTPPPPPVTTHTRWAIRTTGVHETPGGKKLRDIPAGYKFQVVDGSGHGNDGWIETAAGNWVLGADTTTRDPALLSRLSVLSWNVKAGAARVDTVLAELRAMTAEHKPDVVALQECYNLPRFGDAFPGYSFSYQAAGEAKTAGYVSEYPANVMLVRDGVEVKVQAPLEMTESWKGPKVGAMHDPRIHRRVTVLKDGVIWRVVDMHVPPPISGGGNADAIAESNAAMVECLTDFPADEPVIIVGDMNQDNATVVRRVGAPGGAVVDGGGVDLALFRDCTKTKGENLGLHTSDHPAKKWDFEA